MTLTLNELRGWSFLLIGYCLSLSPTLANTNPTPKESDVIIRGQALIKNGQYDAAISLADETLQNKINSKIDSTKWLTIKANAFRHQGKIKQSIELHHSILKIRENQLGKSDILVSNSCQNIGNCWLDLKKPQEALPYLLRAKTIRAKYLDQDLDKIASIYNSLAEAYKQLNQYSKAEDLLERAIEIRQHLDSTDITPLLFSLGSLYLYQNKYTSAYAVLEKGEKELEQQRTPNIYLQSLFWKELGYCLLELGNPIKALALQLKAVQALEAQELDGSDPNVLADFLVALGQTYIYINEPAEAINNLKRGLNFYEFDPQLNRLKIADTYNDLGLAYRYQEQLTRAISFHEQAVNLYLQEGLEDHPNMNGFYLNLGRCLARQGSTNAARYFFNKIDLDEQHINLEGGTKFPITVNLHIGKSFLLEKDPENALIHFNIALNRYRQLSHPDALLGQLILYFMGKSYIEFEQYKDALAYFQDALALLTEKEKEIGIEYYYERSQILSEIGHLEQKRGNLEKSLNVYQEAEALVNKIKENFRNEKSSLYLQDDFASLYNGLLSVSHERYLKGSGQLDLVFQYSEAYKAAQLRKLILQSNAKSFAGIPDSLIQVEKQFIRQRSFFEQRLQNLDQLASAEEIKTLHESIRLLNQQEEALEQYFLDNFPAYVELKRQPGIIDLDRVKENLALNQSLVEYTLIDSTLYTFLIRSDTVVLRKQVLNSSFQASVEDIYYLIRSRPDLVQNRTENYKAYTDLAYELYAILIEPLEGLLQDEIVIIPDGILSYLPFESLIEQQVTHPHLFKNHNYFVQNHAISYCYSASLLELMANREIQNKVNKVIAFAPSFDNSRVGLEPLEYNSIEINSIATLLRATTFSDKQARKNIFLDRASDYRFIHLATHSALDNETPDNSFLAFYDTDSLAVHGLFYMSEVYGIRLNAEMVTLSACQTGIGLLRKGEGLISMARAFAFAGTKSIIASLWSIDDERSSILMQEFYQTLSEGISRSRALQECKKNYLQKSDHEFSHPYYWSGIIQLGDPSQIENLPLKGNWLQRNLIYLISAFIALLGISYFVYFRAYRS